MSPQGSTSAATVATLPANSQAPASTNHFSGPTVTAFAVVLAGLLTVALFWEPIFFKDTHHRTLEISLPSESGALTKIREPQVTPTKLVGRAVSTLAGADTFYSPLWIFPTPVALVDDSPVRIIGLEDSMSGLVGAVRLNDNVLYTTDGMSQSVVLEIPALQETADQTFITQDTTTLKRIHRSSTLREEMVKRFEDGSGIQIAIVSQATFLEIAGSAFTLAPSEILTRSQAGGAFESLAPKYFATFSNAQDLRSVKRELKSQGFKVSSF